MKSDLIAKRHWKWATNALNAANRDAVSRDPQNAVSRAYYAMMHAANAALAVKGLQAKTHKGTQSHPESSASGTHVYSPRSLLGHRRY